MSLAIMAAVAGSASAETVKIALIEGLSGPFAANGQAALREFGYAIDQYINGKNVAGGIKVELIALDNKTSPKETLIQLKNAIGQGASYVLQGNSSGVANALSAAILKHNNRNPDQRIMYLNYAAVDPALTNDKCNFWHFRFDGNADMKMAAITDVIKARKDIKKVYLIGQNYSFGKAVAAAAVKYIGEKRPDIQIVGNELHPIGKVKDFTPYVTKIMASGADAIITGNWGSDMVNLARSANAIGVKADFFTYYAAGTGITAAIGKAGKNRIRLVSEGRQNPIRTDAWRNYMTAFKAKFPNNDLIYPRVVHTIQMLAKAMNKAGSADPFKVAMAMEGLTLTTLDGDSLVMRASDHQLQMPLNISVHTDENIEFDYDKSGFGTYVESTASRAQTTLPTTCKMKRPKA
ncbi:MAG TPA: branched-chain amino acid ABC transporter substrate-binding protein [Rhodospirillales bacterium]|nr:branched-chain amino acid ABC transporter substrate-binding protein [Rhodospirillales bacterium]